MNNQDVATSFVFRDPGEVWGINAAPHLSTRLAKFILLVLNHS